MKTSNSGTNPITSADCTSPPPRRTTPEDCPKFGGCSASICPLDSDFQNRVHLQNERICIYLREAAKHGCRLPETPSLPYKAVNAHYLTIIENFGPIRRALRRSARMGSKLDQQPWRREILA